MSASLSVVLYFALVATALAFVVTRPSHAARMRLRPLRLRALVLAVLVGLLAPLASPALPAVPLPLVPTAQVAHAAETVTMPKFPGVALLPTGQVGMLFDNDVGDASELRFKRYFAEHGLENSLVLATFTSLQLPYYPQLASFQGKLIAAYADSRPSSPFVNGLVFRVSSDNGATWAAEYAPFGTEQFSGGGNSPLLVTSRDGTRLYLFSCCVNNLAQYRSTTDPALASWTSAAAAGDASMRPVSGNNCGNSGQECYRAHNFEFTETPTGRWIYVAKSDSGWGQSGRGTQVGWLGGSWSTQVDLGGSGGLDGCCGESRATVFYDRAGNANYLRADDKGRNVYHARSTDGGYSWGPRVYAYSVDLAQYTTAAPLGLYVPGYIRADYVFFAGHGGIGYGNDQNAARTIPLWNAASTYAESRTARLFGSLGGDWDIGTAYPYAFGRRDVPTGVGAYKTSAIDLALPGRLLDLSFARHYNSADVEVGPFGPAWTHSYDWRLYESDRPAGERAAGALTSASSVLAGGGAAAQFATDGRDTSAWESLAPIANQWLQVDLARQPGRNLVRFPQNDAGASYTAIETLTGGYEPFQAANGVISREYGIGISWSANGFSPGDWWRVTWSSAQSLSRVRLWDRSYASESFASAGRLRFSDGSEVNWSGLPPDIGKSAENSLEVVFPRKTSITWLEVVGDSGGISHGGLAEVEAYDDELAFVRSLGLNLVRFPASGASTTYTAIESYTADYQPAYAANGVKSDGTGAGISWAPDGNAASDWWRATWSLAQSLTRVRLWDRAAGSDYFGTAGRVRFSDGSQVNYSGLANYPGPNGEAFHELSFPRKSGITWLEVVTDGGGVGSGGLAEVEAYDDDAAPWSIGGVRLIQTQAGDCHTASGYKVQSSTDASTWTDRHVVSASTGGDTGAVRFGGGVVSARYWRLLGTAGSTSCGMRVGRFELLDFAQNPASVEVRRGDGRRDIFTRNADGTYVAPADVFDTLTKNAQGGFTLTTKSQVRYEFSPAGRLREVAEPAGNRITFLYSGANLVRFPANLGGTTFTALEEYSPDYSPFYAAEGSKGNGTGFGITWAPDGNAANDWWRATWSVAQSLTRVRLWDRSPGQDYFGSAGRLRFSDGSQVTYSGLPNDPGASGENYLEVSFARKTGITWLEVVTDGGGSGYGGLAEVEAYDDEGPAITESVLRVIADTVGRRVTLGYDGANRITSLTDPLGRKLTYSYDASGRLASVVDKIGNAAGQDPNLHKWQYAYAGSTAHITTVRDPDGRVRVTNTYDSEGRLATQKDGLNNTTTYAYGSGQTTITDPRGNTTTQLFDLRWRPTQQTNVVGGNTYTLQWFYDGVGNLTASVDRNGNRTDFTYDARGNVLTKTDPQINPQTPRYVTTYAYDAKNNLTQLTNARSFITTHTYDSVKNVRLSTSAQIQGSTYATTKWEYTDSANPGLVTKLITPRGNTGGSPDYAYATSYTYNAAGNLSEEITPDNAKTTYTYDGVGRRLTRVDPDGNATGGVPAEHTWTTAYNENDWVTSETDPLNRSTSYSHNRTGERTSVTDRSGNVTTYVHDNAARLQRVEQKPDPVGQPTLIYQTQIGRDANGNATAVTQANGVVTDYAYDALNRLTGFTSHPATGTNLTTSYGLDGNGNTTSRTAADGVVTTYTYDALSRLSSLAAPGLTTITYAYNETSLRSQMIDGTGTSTYAYDGLGRLTQSAQPSGTVTYAYDLDSNRTSLGYPGAGGGTVTYGYSVGGRLLTVSDWGSRTSTYTYSPAGLAASIALPNGMTTTYTYDRPQRLTLLENKVGGTTITRHSYTLDNEGNRTALAEFVSGITAPGGTDSFTMTYDGLHRLTAVAGPVAETFTLDAASNIASRTGPSATNTYDQANRHTSDGAQSLTWSSADRLTQRGSDTFSYDALDRLTSSTVSSTTRTYTYDGDGLLASRTEGSATSFLWDPLGSPQRLLQAASDRVIYGLGPLYFLRGDGTTLTYARDGQKSVRAEVSGAGSVAGSFRYRAYGELAVSSGSGPTLIAFTGQLRDTSGLYYLRARWYDVSGARFLTRDPLSGATQLPQTLNAYAYGGANPLLMSDPSGLAFRAEDAEGAEPKIRRPCEGVTGRCEYSAFTPGFTDPGGVTVVNNADGLEGLYVGVIGLIFNGDSRNTMVLGPNRIVSTVWVEPDSELFHHEMGHIEQIRESGGRTDVFNSVYAVAAIQSGFDHAAHPMEQNANRRVGLPLNWPSERAAPDWNRPYWHFRYVQTTK